MLQDHVTKFHKPNDIPEPRAQNHQQMKKFQCDVCEFNTPLYTELFKHKMSHGGPIQDIEPGELLINVMIEQQEMILDKIALSNQRWDIEFKDVRTNQD